MAADILIYDSNVVPVGRDQKQHVEMTRDIAIKFNEQYGQTFVIPEPQIREEVAVVPGTDGQKMSKSYGNTIEIFGDEKAIRKKIMGIKMDSRPPAEPKPDAEKNLAIQLLKLVAPPNVREANLKKSARRRPRLRRFEKSVVRELLELFRRRAEEARRTRGQSGLRQRRSRRRRDQSARAGANSFEARPQRQRVGMNPPAANQTAAPVCACASRRRRKPSCAPAIRGFLPTASANPNRAGQTGELAVIYDRKDKFLAVGLFDPDSPIRVRILHAGKPQTIDAAWWQARSGKSARASARDLFDAQTTGYRLIHGESDGWPGLVLDRYDTTLVLKIYTAAWLPRLDEILALFKEKIPCERIVLRLSRNIQPFAEKRISAARWANSFRCRAGRRR